MIVHKTDMGESTSGTPGCWTRILLCCCVSRSADYEQFDDTQEVNRLQEELDRNKADVKRIRDLYHKNEAEMNNLKQERDKYKEENEDLKWRLSKMASHRMRDGNPFTEDLNDLLRPTAIAKKWNDLYKSGEYWTAYENLTGLGKSETEAAQLLYRVCEVVYRTCTNYLEELMTLTMIDWLQMPLQSNQGNGREPFQQLNKVLHELRGRLEALLPGNEALVDSVLEELDAQCQELRPSQVSRLQEALRRSVAKLRHTPEVPERVSQNVRRALEEDEGIDVDMDLLESFTQQLLRLCYVMRLHEIPLAMVTDFNPEAELDASLYEGPGSQADASKTQADASKTLCVLRPPLLREEGGAVLAKGEVDLTASKTSPGTEGSPIAGRCTSAQRKRCM